MKPATPPTLRPANGGTTQNEKTELPHPPSVAVAAEDGSTQLRKVIFGGTRFSLLCAASKTQFPVRTTCVTSLLPLLLLLTLPAAVQAQYNYLTRNGAITITRYDCSSGAVTIPSTINGLPVTSIGNGAFANCTSLTSVTIPNSVTSIGGRAFSGCTSLSAITVEALNSFYSSVNGVLFNKSQTTLIQYPGGKAGSYTIPNSVTSIGSFAPSSTVLRLPRAKLSRNPMLFVYWNGAF